MSKLVKLCKGVHVSPKDVTAVIQVSGRGDCVSSVLPHIVVERGILASILIPCETDEESEVMADAIAALVASRSADDKPEEIPECDP